MRLSLPVLQVRTVRWHTGFCLFFFFGCTTCAGSQWEGRVLTSEQPANSLLSFLTTSFPSSMRQESADGMLPCILCSMLPFDKATPSLEIAGSSQGPTSDWGTSDLLMKEVHSLQHFSRNYQDVFSHMAGREWANSFIFVFLQVPPKVPCSQNSWEFHGFLYK